MWAKKLGVDLKKRIAQWCGWLISCRVVALTNMYKIFEKPHIDSEMLQRISVALDYDFFALLSYQLRKEEGISNPTFHRNPII